MRRILLRLGQAVGVLLLLLGLLALAGAAYETIARRSALSRHTPPGRLVDVGGPALHLVCRGPAEPGKPVVILESGVGGWSAHWRLVQDQVAAFAHVCAYDRAGMGWSEPGPTPRDGGQIVQELRTLLTNAAVPGPYILVGASRGGQYARLFAEAYPADVAGVVLVDAEPETMRSRSEFAARAAAQNRTVFPVMGFAARLGIFRLLGALGSGPGDVPELPCLPSALRALPADAQAAYLAVEGQPRCFHAVTAEEAASAAREAQVQAAGDLGDLPLIVLAHGASALPPNAAGLPGAAAYEQIWQALQQDLAGLSSQGELIVAEQSGHNIMLDQPEVVVKAVRRILDADAN